MSAQALFAQAQSIETQLHSVQIYREKALITRRGLLPLQLTKLPVKQILRLGPLPFGIDGDSIRVQLLDHPTLFVQEAQLQWQLPTLKEETQKNNQERTKLQANIERLKTQLNQLQQERSALQALRPSPPSPLREQPQTWATQAPIEGSLALIELIEQEDQHLYKQQLDLEEQLRSNKEALATLQRKQEDQTRQHSEQNTPQRHLLIFLHPQKASETVEDIEKKDTQPTLFISYLLEGARWYPTYELRLAQDGQRAELVLQAQVAQQTGEDWKDVALTLSTADLERSNDLPELETLRLGRKETTHKPSWRPPPPETATLFESYEQAQRKLQKALSGPFTLHGVGGRVTAYGGEFIERTDDLTLAFQQEASYNEPASGGYFSTEADGQGDFYADEDSDEYDDDGEYFKEEGGERQDKALTTLGALPGMASSLEPETAAILYDAREKMKEPEESFASSISERMPPKNRGGLLGGLFGGGGAAPSSSMTRSGGAYQPPDVAREQAFYEEEKKVLRDEEDDLLSLDRMKKKKSGKSGLQNQRPSPSKPKPPVPHKASWLRYETLRLAGPQKNERGSLVLQEEAQKLQEIGFDEDKAYFLAALDHTSTAQRLAKLRALPTPREAMDASQQSAQGGHFAHAYVAQGRFDIPTDGSFHKITLRRLEIPVQLVYRSIPLIDPQFYREARLSNKLNVPLLPGPAQIFWDGDFLRTSPLHLVPEGGEIQLGLGVEERLRIARNTQHKEENRGLMSSQQLLHQVVNLEVRSHLNQAIHIEIVERLPLSSDTKTINILDEHSHPKAASYDQQERQSPIEGGRIWRMELPPQGEKDILFRYTVALPAKHQLDQGSRRA